MGPASSSRNGLNAVAAGDRAAGRELVAHGAQPHDESMVVIRFVNPKGIDMPYLLSMLHDSFMSRTNTLVVPGGKMELAMQLILERRRKALAG